MGCGCVRPMWTERSGCPDDDGMGILSVVPMSPMHPSLMSWRKTHRDTRSGRRSTTFVVEVQVDGEVEVVFQATVPMWSGVDLSGGGLWRMKLDVEVRRSGNAELDDGDEMDASCVLEDCVK